MAPSIAMMRPFSLNLKPGYRVQRPVCLVGLQRFGSPVKRHQLITNIVDIYWVIGRYVNVESLLHLFTAIHGSNLNVKQTEKTAKL